MIKVAKVYKSLKEVVHGFIGHFFSIEVTNESRVTKQDTIAKVLLEEFEDIFIEPIELPPVISSDHIIPLILRSKLVNIRFYKSSDVRK